MRRRRGWRKGTLRSLDNGRGCDICLEPTKTTETRTRAGLAGPSPPTGRDQPGIPRVVVMTLKGKPATPAGRRR